MEWLNTGDEGEQNGEKKRRWLAKAWIGLTFLLVAALSFEAGWLKKSLGETEPLLVTSPEIIPAPVRPERVADRASLPTPVQTSNEGAAPELMACTFVGSKNSNKYHAPTSRCAKQIKPANIVCFDSVEAATAKGYLQGCLD